MEGEPHPDGAGADETTESILEALLVEDAELDWDPKSGKARVKRRRKSELDRTPDTA